MCVGVCVCIFLLVRRWCVFKTTPKMLFFFDSSLLTVKLFCVWSIVSIESFTSCAISVSPPKMWGNGESFIDIDGVHLSFGFRWRYVVDMSVTVVVAVRAGQCSFDNSTPCSVFINFRSQVQISRSDLLLVCRN